MACFHSVVKSIVQRNAAALCLGSCFPWRITAAVLRSFETYGGVFEYGVQKPFWMWMCLRNGDKGQGQAHEMQCEFAVTLGIFPSCSKMLVEIICSTPLCIEQFVSKGYLLYLRSLLKFYV